MPSPITSKDEMYQRLNSGVLGHTLPAAETLPVAIAMIESHTEHSRYAIRSKTSNSGTVFGLTATDAIKRIRQMPPGSWNLSPMLSDRNRVCYGHLIDSVGGWSLTYSDQPRPCKLMPSIDGCEVKNLFGISARMYLRGIMDDVGWQTLLALLESYPDHCVEFAVMSDSRHAHGPTNTIIWEVRCLSGEYERHTWGK